LPNNAGALPFRPAHRECVGHPMFPPCDQRTRGLF
jgi:hypothetical protein